MSSLFVHATNFGVLLILWYRPSVRGKYHYPFYPRPRVYFYALIPFTRMVGLSTPQKGDSDDPFRSELRIDYLLN
jgi:hypothetical protein